MEADNHSFIFTQMHDVCPFPIDSREYFRIQIKSDDKRSTKWIQITPDQFREIERILLEVV